MQLNISLDGVEVRYPGAEHPALMGLNLHINEGERVGIVGSNGAGKSTLLRLIAGFSHASRGRIDVNGQVFAALALGTVLREELSGIENLRVELSLKDKHGAEAEEMLRRMIDFADLGEQISRPVRTYSSGMKARLIFSSLVVSDPDILLIDETLTTGDRFFQPKAAAAIQDLCARGRIVVLVSHSIEAIRAMCTRCIWLDRGAVKADGPAHTVLDQYEAFQRQRIGSGPRDSLATEQEGNGALRFLALAPSGGQDSVLVTGQPAGIEAILAGGAGDLIISMRLERLDGLHIHSWTQHFRWPDHAEKARLTLEISPAIPLAPGHFVCQLEVKSADCWAKGVVAVQLISDQSFTGGEPLLHSRFEIRPAVLPLE